MFKKRRGIKLSYKRQGLIYFVCVNFEAMPIDVQLRILRLCAAVGAADSVALFEFLTDERKSAVSLSMRYGIPEKRLYILRKRFFEKFWNLEF